MGTRYRSSINSHNDNGLPSCSLLLKVCRITPYDKIMIGESLQSVSKLEALEKACKIWFNAPEGRAARELRALTTPERERVWADMTGNKDISTFNVKDDNHVQIGKALASLQTEMVEFASKHPSRALSMAIRTSPGYVCDPQFLFKFLLSKSFSVRSTMALLASHFEMKRELFGEETLGRDIALSDMNEDDISFLRNGFYRFLGGTDSAGRLVAFLVFSDNSDIYSGNSSMVSTKDLRQVSQEPPSVSTVELTIVNFLLA